MADDDVGEADNERSTSCRYEGIPETDASWPSRLVFFWMRPMFRRATRLHRDRRALEHDDLLPLPKGDYGAAIAPVFDQAWAENKCYGANESEETSTWKSTRVLRKSLWAVIGKAMIASGSIRIVNSMLQFAYPILLKAILDFIEDMQAGKVDKDDENRGYWLAALLFCAMAVKAMTENWHFQILYRAGYQARVAVSVSVYEKALRLANSERQDTTLGELVNLMQVDATKIELFVPQMHVLWDGLLQIAGYMAILYTLIGWPCFVGLAVMVFTVPLQAVIMGKQLRLSREAVQYTDERVKTTNEALQGIRCVKMYTWEESFKRTICKSRSLELDFIQQALYLRGYSRAYMEAQPGLVAVASFVVYAVAIPDADISASTLFAALAAFDQLRFPLLFYPNSLAQLAQAAVSAVRVEKFLHLREVGTRRGNDVGGEYSRDEERCKGGNIIMDCATIYWQDPESFTDKDEKSDCGSGDNHASDAIKNDNESEKDSPKPILRNVSLKLETGELCAVVGRVGCGKTTLCNAVLNETVLGGGKISLKGSIAYAAQSPWILNATIRDNILFGLPMDEEKYEKVIESCQLTHDLSLLDDGDLTEIGERGINLSGGQKQRVSVARAAYSNADIVILDDPLSALDPEVGMRLFNECILKLLHGRTRLLVTNALQCLRFCDTIIALGDGEVLEQGTYSDLTSTEGGEVQRLLQELNSSAGKSRAIHSDEEKKCPGDDPGDGLPGKREEKEEKETCALMTKEERNVGAVSWSVYKKYLKAGGGYLAFSWVYIWFILCSANRLMNSVWVTLWTSDANYERQSQAFYLGFYGLTAVTLGVFTYFRTVLMFRFGIFASRILHENLLSSILRAPSSFFDTTPTGRLLSRFSKDLFSIDQELSNQMDFFLFIALTVVVSLGTILFVTPWFGVAIVPVTLIYFRVLNYFREVSRETKRLESISRSPVYAQFSETLGGLAEIRAYGQSERFIFDFEKKVDENTQAFYCNRSAERWLAVRLETIGATITGFAAVFSVQVVVSGGATTQGNDDNFASLAGLSLTYAISLTLLLNWCVRTFAQMEAGMNACERVLYYTENIPHEAPSTSKALEDYAFSFDPADKSDPWAHALVAAGGKAIETSSGWPPNGAITLNNLCMRYRAETPLVLKGINVSIQGGERVGVVGRTGSGKSSLLLCLMRMVEPTLTGQVDVYEPPITIDGVDVLRIGLYNLRSKLGIIPQNPVLFSGTVRSNIDPFDEYTNEQIWTALEQCSMKKAVEAMPDGLVSPVSEYGENLSQGQRQLLCLGRALLKRCRVLLLDEATSSVDYETDRDIQRTIRDSFQGTTVLTIAHRVNTIMDSDRILVMKDGVAEEFAPPQELLANANSIFSDIAKHVRDL